MKSTSDKKERMQAIKGIIYANHITTNYFLKTLANMLDALNLDINYSGPKSGMFSNKHNKFDLYKLGHNAKKEYTPPKVIFTDTFDKCCDYVMEQYYKNWYKIDLKGYVKYANKASKNKKNK